MEDPEGLAHNLLRLQALFPFQDISTLVVADIGLARSSTLEQLPSARSLLLVLCLGAAPAWYSWHVLPPCSTHLRPSPLRELPSEERSLP